MLSETHGLVFNPMFWRVRKRDLKKNNVLVNGGVEAQRALVKICLSNVLNCCVIRLSTPILRRLKGYDFNKNNKLAKEGIMTLRWRWRGHQIAELP
jgi:hypothetical protein